MLQRLFVVFSVLLMTAIPGGVLAASQDAYPLPEPYLGWEKAYLKEFPDLQTVMDAMVATAVKQVPSPQADILHNRVCAALASDMSRTASRKARKLTIATDILHNIAKEDDAAVLTRPEVSARASVMVTDLKKAGFLKGSPQFWTRMDVLQTPKIGDNKSLIHHITGAVQAAEILKAIRGYSNKDIRSVQVAVLEHSTGYWYFRASVDEIAGFKEAWRTVYPEPETRMARIAHDADLISQFVPESVTPAGSKWRVLAKKRWGAKTDKDEAHVVYYVFQRLFDEAKTDRGRELAKAQWEIIKPQLVGLMGLNASQDPLAVLGVPAVFKDQTGK